MVSRAQGAIEYLLIIGAAILVVAIVVIAMNTLVSSGRSQSFSSSESSSTALSRLRESGGIGVKISNYNYSANDTILSNILGVYSIYPDASDTNKISPVYGLAGSGSVYNSGGVTTDKWGQPTISFDGVNTYVKFPEYNSFDLDKNISVSIWVYPNSFSNRQAIISKHTNYEFDLVQEMTGLLSYYDGNGTHWFAMSNPAFSIPTTTGTWHNIVFTRDISTKTTRFYINGSKVY